MAKTRIGEIMIMENVLILCIGVLSAYYLFSSGAPLPRKGKVNMTKTRITELPNIPDLVRESVELVNKSIGDMIENKELPEEIMARTLRALCKQSNEEIREQYLKANTMIFEGILLLAASRGAAISKEQEALLEDCNEEIC